MFLGEENNCSASVYECQECQTNKKTIIKILAGPSNSHSKQLTSRAELIIWFFVVWTIIQQELDRQLTKMDP